VLPGVCEVLNVLIKQFSPPLDSEGVGSQFVKVFGVINQSIRIFQSGLSNRAMSKRGFRNKFKLEKLLSG